MTTHARIQKHGLEQTMFGVTVAAAVVSWVVLIFWWGGLPLALTLVGGAWVAQAAFLARATVDSVRVGPQQMPELWAAYAAVCARLGVADLPPLYLQQSGGVLNAYAARLARRMQVVVHSGLVEALEHDPEALEFIVAHELGHHLAGHTTLARSLLVAPLTMFGLVLLDLGLGRGQEFTADRFGLHGARNLRAAERALIVLLGGRLAAGADASAVEAQWREAGVLARLAELSRTHPNTPRRIAELRAYAAAARLGEATLVAA